ncbi:MAG: hypothetical protein WC340_09450 [Kiritimatiellia bacterium]
MLKAFVFLLFAFIVQAGRHNVDRRFHNHLADLFHRMLEGLGTEVVPVMNDTEHPFECVEQCLAVGFCFGIRQFGQIFDVADQMGDTGLSSDLTLEDPLENPEVFCTSLT